MLLRWITTGLLHDPYQEFMVKVDNTIEKAALETDFNDDYWERRYTVGVGAICLLLSLTYRLLLASRRFNYGHRGSVEHSPVTTIALKRSA